MRSCVKKLTLFALSLLAIALTACARTDDVSPDTLGTHTHNFGRWQTAVQANCTQAGVELRVCSCGEAETHILPATGHSFTEWTSAAEATCTANGLRVRMCACGELETQIIPATGHDGQWAIVTEATCAHEGLKTCICSCGETATESIPALAHSFGSWQTEIAPTCEQPGTSVRVCECGARETLSISALGHDFQSGICTACGQSEVAQGEQPGQPEQTELTFALNADGKSYCVTDIGNYTQQTLVIPAVYRDLPVTHIADHAFFGCSAIVSVDIADSVTHIGEGAFSGCSQLKKVTFGTGLLAIGANAFENCVALTAVSVGQSVTVIGENAFLSCANLAVVYLPSSVSAVGLGAFSDCHSLVSLTVAPENATYHSTDNCLIETASKTLVAGCKTSVVPTDGSVTRIAERAFYGCDGLTQISLGGGMTHIGTQAFFGCVNLTKIEFSGTKAAWDAVEKGSGWNDGVGECTIMCKENARVFPKLKAGCEEITLDATKDMLDLLALIENLDALDKTKLSFTSADPSVAAIVGQSSVSLKKAGNVTITVHYEGEEETLAVILHVTKKKSGYHLSAERVDTSVGQSFELQLLDDGGAVVSDAEWTFSPEFFAYCTKQEHDGKIVVTAVKNTKTDTGNVISGGFVYATAKDPSGKKHTCRIYILP